MSRTILCLLIAIGTAAHDRLWGQEAASLAPVADFVNMPVSDTASTLEILASQMTSNYERIRTWSGTYQLRDIELIEGGLVNVLRNEIQQESEQDASPLVKKESCSGEFVIDFESDSLFTTIRRDESTQFADSETGKELGPRKYQPELYERNILTPEHSLQMEPNRNHRRLKVYRDWAVEEGPVAFRKPPAKAQNDQYGQVVDPRKYMWYAAPFGEYIGHWARILTDAKTREAARAMFHLAKAQVENRIMFRLTVENRDEYLFDSSVGFNPIFTRLGPPERGKRVEWKYEYREIDDVYVVSRLVMTTFRDDGKTIKFSRDWILGKCQLNEPIDPASFTYENLGLQNGNRVVDTIENVGYIYRDGKLTDPVRFQNVQRKPPRTPIRLSEPPSRSPLIAINTVALLLIFGIFLFLRLRARKH